MILPEIGMLAMRLLVWLLNGRGTRLEGGVFCGAAIGVAGTNSIDRFYDNFGRDTGYALNGVRQSTLAYDPATARLLSMQISRTGGSPVQDEGTFSWSYLPGSDLKSSLSYPNGLVASWTYDANNQLLQVCNATPTNVISQYDYTYDAAGRRVACGKSGSAFAHNDTIAYAYNTRSELTNAVAAVDSDYRYAYDFDDIGNRETSSERGTNFVYAANQLNQYCSVTTLTSDVGPQTSSFSPQFDDDGNKTLIKTATGIWHVTYNGENRPILWENVSPNSSTPNSSTPTLISMSYDRMGRRVTKNNQRFVYNGYLQIANFELVATNSQLTTHNSQLFIWDPIDPVATRPLAWHRGTSIAYYTFDGNKDVSEVVAANGTIDAHYEYAPFGAISFSCGTFAADPPWRFSSEYAEDDTATVYYNYRHYEPNMGRWMRRDYVEEFADINLFSICKNNPASRFDFLGAIGLTVSKNKYKMQRFRVISEYVYCPFVKCDKCYEPCMWRSLNDQESDLPLLRATETYTGGMSYYEIAHGLAEELAKYFKGKAEGYVEGKILKWLLGKDVPGIPFQDKLDALSDSKYKGYLVGDKYKVDGYDNYIFTGYKHSVGGVHHYPANHLIVPSCKNRHKTSTYYTPIGMPYWTEDPQ